MSIAAAGNTGSDNDSSPVYPCSYAYDNVISVAATDRYDSLAASSNWGWASVDIGAPGVDVYSTIRGGVYGFKIGTSHAAPYVSGVAALAFSINPNASVGTIRSAILNNADAKTGLAGRVATGGRLNAFRTLQSLAPASMIVNGDVSGSATDDTILVRLDPANTNYIQALVNGVEEARAVYSGVTTIAVNGIGGNDTLTIDTAITRSGFVSGGDGNDWIQGGSGADNVNGNAGNDTVRGGPGNDTVGGGLGNDTLSGGAGADVFNGGDGIDLIDFNGQTNAVTVRLDGLANDGPAGDNDNIGPNGDVENVTGGSAADLLVGNGLANSLQGGPGNDTLWGGDGNDTVAGGQGDDEVHGGTGADILNSGQGVNRLYGDDGDDVFYTRNSLVDSLDGGTGYDQAQVDSNDVLSNVEALLA